MPAIAILGSVDDKPERASWAGRLLPDGTDPDPRFSLANERTFLAWLRTSLGLIAVGIGVATFVSTQMSRGLAVLLSAGLIVLGGAIGAASWFRWVSVERALRTQQGIPPWRVAPMLAFGIAVLALVAIAAVVLAL